MKAASDNQMKLTKEQLIALKPCYLESRLALFGKRQSLTVKQAIKAGVGVADLLWVAGKLGHKDLIVQFTNEMAKRAKEHSTYAAYAADAAYAAANAAADAAARAAANAAADAAAYAVDAARTAADAVDAAYAAAYATAYATYAAYAAANTAYYAADAAAYAVDAVDAARTAANAEIEVQKQIFLKIFK